MRVLDAQDIPYEVVAFPDSIHDALGVAEFTGLPAEEVYKTLVVQNSAAGAKPLLVMVSADHDLDLKILASAAGAKKVQMARQRDAEQLTGLKVGGISALALLNRGFDIYIDAQAKDLNSIVISAGKRGLNLRLAAADLIRVTGAKVIEAS